MPFRYINKAIRKLNSINKLIKKHPIASKNRAKALIHYTLTHTIFHSKERVINWFSDLKFYFSKGDASFSGNYYFGLAEWQESLFLVRYLRSTDRFLDIGANHGHYSLLAAKFGNCEVLAIEPIPETYKQLLRNINLNGLSKNIKTIQAGLSNAKGKLFFSTDKKTMNKIVSSSYQKKIEIDVTTINDLQYLPSVIKMDVEGYEFDVLKGADNILRNNNLNIIICEINWTLRKGISQHDILSLLDMYHYKPYYYDGSELILLTEANKETFNTIFIKNIDLVNERLIPKRAVKIWGVEI